MNYENPNTYWHTSGDFNNDDEQSRKMAVASFVSALLSIIIGCIIAFFIGCSMSSCATKVVTVPEYHTQYVNHTDTFLRVDSVVHNTNTIIREANKDDSLMLAKYGIKLKENERVMLLLQSELEKAIQHQSEVRTDTFVKTDSISVPYPVEKPLTWWQRTKIRFGEYVLGLLLVITVLLVVKFAYGGRKKVI